VVEGPEMTLLGSLEASSNRRGRERYPKGVILGSRKGLKVPKRAHFDLSGSRGLAGTLKVVKMDPFEPFWHKPQVCHTNLQD
jgi:hypothetical protein